jgi:AraC family transcriptional activator of tynA and feaB
MSDPETWNLSEFAREDRTDAWRTVIAETHLPWEVRVAEPDRGDYDARVRRRRLGDLALIECACQPCSGFRGGRQLRNTAGEYVSVLVVVSGSEVVSQQDRQVMASPGTMLLWDSVRPADFAARTTLRKQTLLIPRNRFAVLFPRPESVIGQQPLDSHAGRLFRSYLRFLTEHGPPLDGVAATAAGNAALELLTAAVRPATTVSPSTLHVATRARVNDYIERHLAEPGLSPRQVAVANCMSVRSLYLLFEKDGDTVSAHIRLRRLARSRADLIRLGEASPITEIAFRWGFSDAANFSRAFRRQYGQSPTEARRARFTTETSTSGSPPSR